MRGVYARSLYPVRRKRIRKVESLKKRARREPLVRAICIAVGRDVAEDWLSHARYPIQNGSVAIRLRIQSAQGCDRVFKGRASLRAVGGAREEFRRGDNRAQGLAYRAVGF